MFVAEGAKVVMTDVSEDAGRALAAEIGNHTLFLKHDVTKLNEWYGIISAAKDAFGGIDILVNNAGILGAMANTEELTEQDYLAVCAVNQHSVFYGMKAVLPAMLERG